MQDIPASVWELDTARQFSEVVTGIKDVRIMQNFLRDAMTEKEIIEISSRLEAARMLQEGSKYADIIERTKLSSRTVARISDWLQNGCGGYESVLDILKTHHGHTPPACA